MRPNAWKLFQLFCVCVFMLQLFTDPKGLEATVAHGLSNVGDFVGPAIDSIGNWLNSLAK